QPWWSGSEYYLRRVVQQSIWCGNRAGTGLPGVMWRPRRHSFAGMSPISAFLLWRAGTAGSIYRVNLKKGGMTMSLVALELDRQVRAARLVQAIAPPHCVPT